MKNIVKNKAWDLVEEYNIDKLLYLLIDRSTKITNWNDFIWENNKNNGHRDYDLPANVGNDGYVSWWKNGKRYRSNNKPVRIWSNGRTTI